MQVSSSVVVLERCGFEIISQISIGDRHIVTRETTLVGEL